MRRMISETRAKVLDNLAVNKDGTVIEVGGNVALESPEQAGHYVDKYHRVHCIIDEAIGTNDPVVLVEGATTFIQSDEWYDVSSNPDAQVPPIENGQVVYVQGDKMFYKENNTIFYSQVDNLLLCDGTLTEWGKKWQGMGYIQEGGRVFQPLFAEPKKIEKEEIYATNDLNYQLWLEDVVSPQAYYIGNPDSSDSFNTNTYFSIHSLDGAMVVILGENIKTGFNTTIDSCEMGISVYGDPNENTFANLLFGRAITTLNIYVNNRIIYVECPSIL